MTFKERKGKRMCESLLSASLVIFCSFTAFPGLANKGVPSCHWACTQLGSTGRAATLPERPGSPSSQGDGEVKCQKCRIGKTDCHPLCRWVCTWVCWTLGFGISEMILIKVCFIKQLKQTPSYKYYLHVFKSICYALELKVFCIFWGVYSPLPDFYVDSIFHKFLMKVEKFWCL